MSKILCTLEGVNVVQEDDGRVHFVAKAAIDADGAYRAYHPEKGKGLDALANAGKPGNWWGIVTDAKGKPFIQGPKDPAPGFYVSATAYEWKGFKEHDPKRYVDSETVPFVVVSPVIRRAAKGVVLGCKAIITNTVTGQWIEAVVADIGPRQKIGELSIAGAKAVGVDGNPRRGGTDKKIIHYQLFPGTPAIVNGVKYNLIPA